MRNLLWTRRGLATGALAILAACGSSSTPGGKDAGGDATADGPTEGGKDASKDASGNAACASYATAYCDHIAACTPGVFKTTYGGSTSTCNTVETTLCETGLAAPSSGINAAWASACGVSLATKATACKTSLVPTAVPSPTDPCAVTGARGPGASCGVDEQCATDACIRTGELCGQCTGAGVAGTPCGPGTGITCNRGLACSAVNETCATIVEEGMTCTPGTADCIGGTTCVVAAAGDTSGTCQVSGTKAGTACNPQGIVFPGCYQDAGFSCDAVTNMCVAITYAAPLSPCGTADGGTSLTECSGGACVGGSCVALSSSGSCTVAEGECQAGSICVTANGSAAGTCTPVDVKCDAPDGGTAAFGFSPSNVSLADILEWASMAQAENVASACTVATDPASPDTDCFNSPIEAVTQPDGSTVNVVVVTSLIVQSAGSIAVTGGVPLVVVSLSDVTFLGSSNLQANAANAGLSLAPGGGAGGTTGAGAGNGGGHAGSTTTLVGGGGGSFCGVGGGGGGGGTKAAAYGTADIRPLVGGSGGGDGALDGGNGGGGIQIVATGTISLAAGAYITVSGAGGNTSGDASAFQNGSGGGSGGAILLEAPTVIIAGTLAANGGGGGGATSGQDGWDDTGGAAGTPAAGGTGTPTGGAGGAGTTLGGTAGGAGVAADYGAGGGGGGIGRIRINSKAKAATLTGTTSPATTIACTTQGFLRTIAEGP